MDELQIFNYGEIPIRTIMQDDEPWWVLADVCRVLEIANSRNVAVRLDGDEKNTVHLTDGIQGNPNMTVISESGLYKVILRSDKPEAKKFTRWVTHEVLPALRKTGQYSLHPVTEQRGLTIDDYLKAASIVANCRNERLPYVLGFLEQGGLSIPKIQEMSAGKLVLADGRHTRYAKTDEDVNAQAAACAIINEAVERYGFSLAQIGRITGIHSGRICNYKKGKRPTPDRARYIVDVLTRYLPQED